MKHALVLAAFLFSALLVAPARAQREPVPTTEISGTVTGFDADQSILDVNTRLGRRLFLLTSTTLILLNNHSSTTTAIQSGDDVTVTYRFDTSEATVVHLVRETKLQGTIRTVSNTALDFRVKRNTSVSLRTDANSLIEIAGIKVANNAILAGRTATALVEPSSLLLISMEVDANSAQAKITLIDTAAGTITIGGRKPRTFKVVTNATIRRDGAVVTLADLVVGDQVKVAFVKQSGTLQALAIRAQSAASMN